MSQTPEVTFAAYNIRAALQNLNELVEDAYRDHEIVVQYEIKRVRHFEQPGNPKILAVISQEVA